MKSKKKGKGKKKKKGKGREGRRVKAAERARQIWATVTFGRWLGALASVYLTLADQEEERRLIPAASGAGDAPSSLQTAVRLGLISAGSRRPRSAPLGCLLFSRGQRLLRPQSTQPGRRVYAGAADAVAPARPRALCSNVNG